MKPAEIRALANERLAQQIADLQAEWRSLRFQEAVGQLTATARGRFAKTSRVSRRFRPSARSKPSWRRSLVAGSSHSEWHCEERR
jgi:ribosomal protein L29